MAQDPDVIQYVSSPLHLGQNAECHSWPWGLLPVALSTLNDSEDSKKDIAESPKIKVIQYYVVIWNLTGSKTCQLGIQGINGVTTDLNNYTYCWVQLWLDLTANTAHWKSKLQSHQYLHCVGTTTEGQCIYLTYTVEWGFKDTVWKGIQVSAVIWYKHCTADQNTMQYRHRWWFMSLPMGVNIKWIPPQWLSQNYFDCSYFRRSY